MEREVDANIEPLCETILGGSVLENFYDAPVEKVWDTFGFNALPFQHADDRETTCKIGKVNDYEIAIITKFGYGYYSVKMKNRGNFPVISIGKKLPTIFVIAAVIIFLLFILPILMSFSETFIKLMPTNPVINNSFNIFEKYAPFVVTLVILYNIKTSKQFCAFWGRKSGNSDFDANFRIYTLNNFPGSYLTKTRAIKLSELENFNGVTLNGDYILLTQIIKDGYCDANKAVDLLMSYVDIFDN